MTTSYPYRLDKKTLLKSLFCSAQKHAVARLCFLSRSLAFLRLSSLILPKNWLVVLLFVVFGGLSDKNLKILIFLADLRAV